MNKLIFKIQENFKNILIGVLFLITIILCLVLIFKKPEIKIKEKIVEVQVEKPVYIDKATGENVETYWYYTWSTGSDGVIGYNTIICSGNLFDYKNAHEYLFKYLKKTEKDYVEITSAIQITKESYEYQQGQEN